jgi:uncharacterized protein (DUF2252 family)
MTSIKEKKASSITPAPDTLYVTREQSSTVGRKVRVKVTRASQGIWKEPLKRRNPVDILIESNAGREPNLIPIRYGRMLLSPFTFFRGAAAIMAADLARTPHSGIIVQACGDCHLMNFGFYGTPERRVLFDINDFDETLPAPWEWDLKRLASSFVVATRHHGFDEKEAHAMALRCARSYRTRMAEFAEMSPLKIWHANISSEKIIEMTTDAELKKRFKKRLEKAASRSLVDEDFPKLANIDGQRTTIKDNPPLIYHHEDADIKKHYPQLLKAFNRYLDTLSDEKKLLLSNYKLHDYAAKVVGVGSVGTRCSILLSLTANNEPLFLQVKEARNSVLEGFAGKSKYLHRGQRVVAGQRLMQAASDMFLGWSDDGKGREYYIRQLRDMKIKPQVELFDQELMSTYADLCGWALARAHARSGKSAIISAYLGLSSRMDESVADFAASYALTNERDYRVLKKAVKDGVVEAYFEK